MTVGERIAARRKELNMTQEELAKKLGYKSKSSINKIELQWSNVPLSKLERIAAALDCEPGYLMGWDEKKDPLYQLAEKKVQEEHVKELVNGDPELTEILERARDDPHMRMLFSVTKDATAEDLEKAIKIIQTLKGE